MIEQSDLLLLLGAFLFVTGTLTVMIRRNTLVILMGVELMLNGVNLTFVTFSRVMRNIDGQVAAFFIITVAAAEAAVGLSILVNIYRLHRSVTTEKLNELKG